MRGDHAARGLLMHPRSRTSLSLIVMIAIALYDIGIPPEVE
jgi:hypothetical protein